MDHPKLSSIDNKFDHSPSYYKRLMGRIVFMFIILSILPLLLINGLIGYKVDELYKKETIENFKLVYQKHKRTIENFLDEKIYNILLISDIFRYNELIDDKKLNFIFDNLKTDYGNVFVDLGIINKDGIQISYAGPFKLKGANYIKQSWFNEAKKQYFYISDVFLGFRKLPHFIISIKKIDGNNFYLIKSTLDFFYFNKIVEDIKIGNSGFAYIVNEKGEVQTDVNPFLEDNKKFLKSILAKVTNPNAINCFESKNEFGEKAIYIISKLRNKDDWFLVYQQPKEYVFGDLYFIQKILFIAVSISIFVVVIVSYFIAKRFVSHIKKLDKEKQIMNEQIVEAGKLASLGELAAGIAHEINNPVAIILEECGWLKDILEESIPDVNKRDEFLASLNQIKIQGKRCKEITHKLLSFARRIDTKVSKIQLNKFIQEIVSLSERRAKYNNIKINLFLSRGLPEIYGSPSELQQVFLNLINNSIDAIDSHNGGLINISTKRQKDSILCSIFDTGCGIPKANLSRIFDPFFTTKPVGKGTGLGLSICYGIIKKMGGDIKVESEVGKGTTFTLSFPIKYTTKGGKNGC
ncbi:sensor histidine kinase [Desulfonauticus submarinus]